MTAVAMAWALFTALTLTVNGGAPAQTPLPLRVVGGVDVVGDDIEPTARSGDVQSFSFIGPSRCDSDGNVYLVLASQPHALWDGLPARANEGRRLVVRVSADGIRRTVDLESAVGVDEGGVVANETAVDPSGNFYILGIIGGGVLRGRSIIAMDRTGDYSRKIEVDETRMTIDRFAVFASGEFLLIGQDRRTTLPVMAVMPANGGSVRTVPWPITPSAEAAITHAESGSDGRVYFVQAKGTKVHAISPSGRIEGGFELVVPPVAGLPLLALRVSGQRVAGIYQGPDPQRREASLTRWAVVQDTSTGMHVATYGPLPHMLLCYRVLGSADLFTMLKVDRAGWRLLTGSPQ